MTVVPPETGPQPGGNNVPKIFPVPAVVAAPLLTIIGVLIPKGGPEFPLNDETIFIKYPEIRYTVDPNVRLIPPSDPNDNRRPLYLVRSRAWPESMESLAADAKRALEGGFPHSVSAWLKWRVSGTDKFKRSAKL